MISGLGLIVVAAGSSARMQGTDKIWAHLDGHTVLWHSVHALCDMAEQTVVVVRDGQQERAQAELAALKHPPKVISGGLRRQDSVACGLDQLQELSMVAVHDAARPLARSDLIYQGVELLKTCDGAVPALRVNDTMKQIDDYGGIVRTFDRSNLRSVQTPQIFNLNALRDAHGSQHARVSTVTDDAGLLEACQYDVRVFTGQEGNFKITTAFDLWLIRQLVVAWHTNS